MDEYWFFLSYSRRDAEGEGYLKQFYEDLALAVGRSAALESTLRIKDIGFFDASDIETGNQWDDTLAEALHKSRTLVCLYSRSYFNSVYCGKEFKAFRIRLEDYAASQGVGLPPLILPVLWDRPLKLPKKLPDIVSKIQYTHDEFGKVYAEQGLDLLMKQEDEYKGAYKAFIVKFADKLVDEAQKNVLLPSKSHELLENIQSAFHVIEQPKAAAPPSEGDDVDPDNVGPDFAHFIYVAGHVEEFKSISISKEKKVYGEKGGRFWRPYIPDPDTPVEFITASAALEEKLRHEVLAFNKSVARKLRKLDETNTIAVLVVDPWTLMIESYKNFLFDYDKGGNLPNCGVLIIWNEKDTELTPERREELKNLIEKTFPNKMVFKDICFRDSILSAGELRTELIDVIRKIKERIEQRMKLLRPRPKAPAEGESFPTISAN